MSYSTQLAKQRFFLVFFAALLISLCIAGLAILSTANRPPAQSNPAVNKNSENLPTTTAPTVSVVQNDLTAAPVHSSLDTPAVLISESLEWRPLPSIPDDYRGLITNGDRAEYKIALTFDACQREGELTGYDAEIIRVLNETKTPATFFLGGLWMRDHQAETLELASNSLFELGNHSWSHADFSSITPDEMGQQILLAQKYMYNLLGYQTNLFRLPYGTYNEEALKAIGESGLYTIQWDNVSGDPDPNIDAQRMTSWVLQQVQPGSIIIMHANGRGWHTAEALPAIIESIHQQGYTLVTISDLLKIQPYR